MSASVGLNIINVKDKNAPRHIILQMYERECFLIAEQCDILSFIKTECQIKRSARVRDKSSMVDGRLELSKDVRAS